MIAFARTALSVSAALLFGTVLTVSRRAHQPTGSGASAEPAGRANASSRPAWRRAAASGSANGPGAGSAAVCQ